ncbi:hypothetical protein BC939DRAFT_5868 [Gamsiella multidivaricata]|uniref:uncharacterized protein n=1 Tax=Gamsiella multidivaricata TaxID=101098 RepID=UPI0022202AB3|nr:uncharacterized protein BC939DRAFT_5868 [Gamsiella multidivaricata]KAG0366295.1 hypothetical protein BGZ54_005554 [Gamsiella multidivaricata]KAI7832771.1 hypothetical protein BC939DRAFT_5868 [Gamsiella multidivaricata]
MKGSMASLPSSFKIMAHNIISSRKSRRHLLLVLLFSIIIFLFLTFQQSSVVLDLGSYGGFYGFDSSRRPITRENHQYRGKTVARLVEIPEATWTCTDDHLSEEEKDTQSNRRTRQCVVENLCVDRKGAFIRGSGGYRLENMPKVNLLSSDTQSDVYWQPRVERIWSKTMKAHYVNDTLFVHGLYSPFHFSHWLYNGMMPLYSTMRRFGGTKNSWTFRAARFSWDPIDRQGTWEMDHFFQTGQELVLSQYELATSFQTLPPSDAPVCFRRAVIGLGSQCALDYCEKSIPAEIYQSFRDEIAEYYWQTPQIWERHLSIMKQTIRREAIDEVLRKAKKKDDGTPIKCLELARYYNFEEAGPGHGVEPEEKKNRVGQRFPDVSDPEQDYQNRYTEAEENGGSKRKLVVGIIQREKSRRLINDQELINSLVEAGFRVKWMSFDHGCGLAETAYLLRDVQVLISPHGNAIGTSVFMPTTEPVPTLISVDSSRYWENWFKYTATAIGQRFISTACGPSDYKDEATKAQCPFYKDFAAGKKQIENNRLILGIPASMVKSDEEKKNMSNRELGRLADRNRAYVRGHPEAQALAAEELEILIGAELPVSLIQKYGEDVWSFLSEFWKAMPRYVDVTRVIKFMQARQADLEREKQENLKNSASETMTKTQKTFGQYLDYVKEGKACGFEQCETMLNRNVVQDSSAFAQYSTDNIDKWGQHKPESEAMRQGITELKNWIFDV